MTQYVAKCQQNLLVRSVIRQTVIVFKTKGSKGDTGEGVPGKMPEFRATQTMIQWRYVGDTTWIDLAPLGTGSGGGVQKKKIYEATGSEAGVIPNSVAPGIAEATFTEIQQGPRWLDQYLSIGAVPENHYRIEANGSITLGTIPEFQESIYIKWTL